MKRFTSILAVVALTSVANAADTVDMKWNAELRSRYTSETNWGNLKGDKVSPINSQVGSYNHFGQRNRLGLHLTKGEDFQGHITLMNHFYWGSTKTQVSNGLNPGNNSVITSDGTDSSALLVNEAYGWWKASDMVSLRFGRMHLEIAGGFVVASDDFMDFPYAYDGIVSSWDFEPLYIHAAGLKLKDGNTEHAIHSGLTTRNGSQDPESLYYGFIFGFKTLPEFFKKAEIHLFQINDDITDGIVVDPATTPIGSSRSDVTFRSEIMRYGLYLAGDHMGFDFRGALDMYGGKSKYYFNNTSTDYDLSGSMWDLALGYTFAEAMNLRVGGFYHTDSGGEKTTSTNKSKKTYVPGNYDSFRLGGSYLDAVTWGNLTFYGLSLAIKPMDDLSADLTWTKFTRTNDKDVVLVYGSSAGLTSGGDASNDIGSEIDLTVTKTYGDSFSIWALYGMFTPGDLVKKDALIAGATNANNTLEEDTHTRIQVQAKLTF